MKERMSVSEIPTTVKWIITLVATAAVLVIAFVVVANPASAAQDAAASENTRQIDELLAQIDERDTRIAELETQLAAADAALDELGTSYYVVLEIRRTTSVFSVTVFEDILPITLRVTREEYESLEKDDALSQFLPYISLPSNKLCTEWTLVVTNKYTG